MRHGGEHQACRKGHHRAFSMLEILENVSPSSAQAGGGRICDAASRHTVKSSRPKVQRWRYAARHGSIDHNTCVHASSLSTDRCKYLTGVLSLLVPNHCSFEISTIPQHSQVILDISTTYPRRAPILSPLDLNVTLDGSSTKKGQRC